MTLSRTVANIKKAKKWNENKTLHKLPDVDLKKTNTRVRVCL